MAVNVTNYQRRDGTKVRAHSRSDPDFPELKFSKKDLDNVDFSKSLAVKVDKGDESFRNMVRDALKHHSKRPEANRMIDNSKSNNDTYKMTERGFNNWKGKPGKYDLEGIDTPTNNKKRWEVFTTDGSNKRKTFSDFKEAYSFAKSINKSHSKVILYDIVSDRVIKDFSVKESSKMGTCQRCKKQFPKSKLGYYVDGNNRSITKNAPLVCKSCYVKNYAIKKESFSDDLEKLHNRIKNKFYTQYASYTPTTDEQIKQIEKLDFILNEMYNETAAVYKKEEVRGADLEIARKNAIGSLGKRGLIGDMSKGIITLKNMKKKKKITKATTTSEISNKTVILTGNTYTKRREIKAQFGARWNSDKKGWVVRPHYANAAKEYANKESGVVAESITIDNNFFRELSTEDIRKIRTERNQRNADRLLSKASRLERESESSIKQARKMGEAIPFGQPILVGHHSEGRDRRYRARMVSKYDKGFSGLKEAESIRERAERLQKPAIVKGDAAKGYAQQDAERDKYVKVGSKVIESIYGSGTVTRINKRTYTIRYESGFKTTMPKHFVKEIVGVKKF